MTGFAYKPLNEDRAGDTLVFTLYSSKYGKMLNAGDVLKIEDVIKIRSLGISNVLVYER